MHMNNVKILSISEDLTVFVHMYTYVKSCLAAEYNWIVKIELNDTSSCDHLLALPSYQSWRLWVSGSSCRCLWNIVLVWNAVYHVMISAGDETWYIGCTLLELHDPFLGHTKKIQRNRSHDILGWLGWRCCWKVINVNSLWGSTLDFLTRFTSIAISSDVHLAYFLLAMKLGFNLWPRILHLLSHKMYESND